MAGTPETLNLKRKREGAEPHRKKAKREEKSKAAEAEAQNGTPGKVETATPVAKPTPKPTPTPKAKHGLSEKPQTNGARESAAGTPSSSRKDRKQSKLKGAHGLEITNAPAVRVEDQAAAEATPVREQKIVGGNAVAAESASKDSKTKKSEKQKWKERNRKSENVIKEKVPENSRTEESIAASSGHGDKEAQPSKKKKEKKSKGISSDRWSISGPHGGWFLPQDPVFSRDEKCLLLAKLQALEVYSTETSLLANELPLRGSAVILAYALSASEPNHVYIVDSAGIVTLRNWTNRSMIGRWDIGGNVRHLAVVTQPESALDLLYCYEAGGSHIINVHALRTANQSAPTELKCILKSSSPITGLQVFLQGKIVVVSSADSIMIGKPTKLHKTALQDLGYTWQEFKTSKRITAFNAHIRLPENLKGKNLEQDPRDHLDLAIGDEEGAIHLFEDILASFAAIEKSQKGGKDKSIGPESLRPKRLHWHRDAVGSLKWSLDGNYLISGGNETVITIWQLSTGKQQHLPHLTAAIEHIVVSPSGASYAISLANNSVIVLSTSELEARTNIVGVQSRRIDLEQLPRETNPRIYPFEIFGPIPMAIDAEDGKRVLFTTPSSQPRHRRRSGLVPEPYLQTFDMATQRAISRQALTRNNATDPNMGPEGRRIDEPSVKFLQVSCDGKWLATVDEWIPPRADMGFLEEGIPAFNEEERTYRREVYLKFWLWDAKSSQWSLGTRIDAPHFLEALSAHASVFDLVADPSGLGFATVGEDRFIRVWRPRTRIQGGLVVRGADKPQGLVTWSLDRLITIPSQLDVGETNGDTQEWSDLRTCRLSFSSDGSALAAGVSWMSEGQSGVIHIVDTEAGIIRRSITELEMRALSGIGIIGRYLVAVSGSVIVWDMVLDQLVYFFPVETPGVDIENRAPFVRLAVNEEDGTFAVSVPQFEKNHKSKSRDTKRFKKASAKVHIFNTDNLKAPWSTKLPGIVLGLAPVRGRGYVALDSASSIRVIGPKAIALQLPTPPPGPEPQLLADGMDVDIKEEDDDTQTVSKKRVSLSQFEANEGLWQDSENDKPVVRPEQLQDLFERGPSHSTPACRDQFSAFVALRARKPNPHLGLLA